MFELSLSSNAQIRTICFNENYKKYAQRRERHLEIKIGIRKAYELTFLPFVIRIARENHIKSISVENHNMNLRVVFILSISLPPHECCRKNFKHISVRTLATIFIWRCAFVYGSSTENQQHSSQITQKWKPQNSIIFIWIVAAFLFALFIFIFFVGLLYMYIDFFMFNVYEIVLFFFLPSKFIFFCCYFSFY